MRRVMRLIGVRETKGSSRSLPTMLITALPSLVSSAYIASPEVGYPVRLR